MNLLSNYELRELINKSLLSALLEFYFYIYLNMTLIMPLSVFHFLLL